jgi:7-keto-8-aminopelargonate synthetase-like enzyme
MPNFIEQKLRIYEEELFSSTKNGKHLVLGKEPSTGAIMLQSNDYLGLSKHPNISAAQVSNLRDHNQDAVMSAVFLHEDSAKGSFEANMATYTGYEKAILSQSGWAANVGLMQVIADKDTNIYIDFFAHMSLWEGIKSCGAKAFPFRHNNSDSLESLIKKHGSGIIVVDSVYSTNGDLCPLVDVVNLATRYGCALVVDESHSLGTHGPKGAGLVAELGLTDQVHFVTASLAKTFAARAGIILCSNRVARCFPYIAHPAIFSSTLLPYEIAGLAATLELIIKSDKRRKKLRRNAAYLREGLTELGYSVASMSQIVSLEGGREEITEQIRDALEDRNIFGSVFCKPATPKNRSLLRFSLNSNLSFAQLDYILSACSDIRHSIPIELKGVN